MKDTWWLIPLFSVLFISLKACHLTDWSWWWVLAPPLAPLAIGLVYVALAALLTKGNPYDH